MWNIVFKVLYQTEVLITFGDERKKTDRVYEVRGVYFPWVIHSLVNSATAWIITAFSSKRLVLKQFLKIFQ